MKSFLNECGAVSLLLLAACWDFLVRHKYAVLTAAALLAVVIVGSRMWRRPVEPAAPAAVAPDPALAQAEAAKAAQAAEAQAKARAEQIAQQAEARRIAERVARLEEKALSEEDRILLGRADRVVKELTARNAQLRAEFEKQQAEIERLTTETKAAVSGFNSTLRRIAEAAQPRLDAPVAARDRHPQMPQD